MTDSGSGDHYVTWDAAYVLGSLSSTERREYAAHLETCDRCRAAVAELSGMPALLGLLSAEDARDVDVGTEQLPPLGPEVFTSVLDRVRWRRRRLRWLTSVAVGVAATLLVAGLVIAAHPGIVGLQGGTTQTVAQLEMTKVEPTPFSAAVSLSSFAWGTRIDMACTYGEWSGGGDPPSSLGMVVVGRDGTRTQIATWLGLAGATALPSGNTPIPTAEIASVELVSADSGRVLLERRL